MAEAKTQEKVISADVKYTVNIFTGYKSGAGTNANIFFTLHGTDGESLPQTIKNQGPTTFERGMTYTYKFDCPYLGTLTKIRIGYDNTGGGSNWYLGKVTVVDPEKGDAVEFPCDDWLQPNADGMIEHELRKDVTPLLIITKGKSSEISADGMEPGPKEDERISASSSTHDITPSRSRLNFPGRWYSGEPSEESWLQVDLSEFQVVTSMEIQCHPYGSKAFVKKFEILHSEDGKAWSSNDENGNQIFKCNKDNTTIKVVKFQTVIYARYIRIRPVQWYAWPCMRIELYGIPSIKVNEWYLSCMRIEMYRIPSEKVEWYASCMMMELYGIPSHGIPSINGERKQQRQPLGMESGKIKDERISASSSTHDNIPSCSRLNFPDCWCSGVPQGSWLQVDLIDFYVVTSLAIQGNPNGNKAFVKKFEILYSEDGKAWSYHEENGNRIFEGNKDNTTIKVVDFQTVIIARYIRICPVEWYVSPCMSIELYGIPSIKERCPLKSSDIDKMLSIENPMENWSKAKKIKDANPPLTKTDLNLEGIPHEQEKCRIKISDIDMLMSIEKEPKENWSKVKETKNAVVWRRKATKPYDPPLTKTDLILDGVPYEQAVKYITDWEQRQKWDKTFDVIDILERSGNFNVIYCSYKIHSLCDNREVVLACLDQDGFDQQYHIQTMHSVTHPDVQQGVGTKPTGIQIRAENLMSGIIIRPINDGSKASKVTVITQVDLRGLASKRIKNKFHAKQPIKWMEMMKQYHEKNKEANRKISDANSQTSEEKADCLNSKPSGQTPNYKRKPDYRTHSNKRRVRYKPRFPFKRTANVIVL